MSIILGIIIILNKSDKFIIILEFPLSSLIVLYKIKKPFKKGTAGLFVYRYPIRRENQIQLSKTGEHCFN